MIQDQQIKDFASEVAVHFSPEKIILFGSHARGQAYAGSDVDILIVLDHETENVEKAIEILNLLHPHFALDLLVRRPKDVARRIAMNDYFMKQIIEQGVTLYDGSRSRVG